MFALVAKTFFIAGARVGSANYTRKLNQLNVKQKVYCTIPFLGKKS